jgi:hypothetical protein
MHIPTEERRLSMIRLCSIPGPKMQTFIEQGFPSNFVKSMNDETSFLFTNCIARLRRDEYNEVFSKLPSEWKSLTSTLFRRRAQQNQMIEERKQEEKQ